MKTYDNERQNHGDDFGANIFYYLSTRFLDIRVPLYNISERESCSWTKRLTKTFTAIYLCFYLPLLDKCTMRNEIFTHVLI